MSQADIGVRSRGAVVRKITQQQRPDIGDQIQLNIKVT